MKVEHSAIRSSFGATFPDDTNLLMTGKDEFDFKHKVINVMTEIWF
jgi:hypothetical protein